MRIAITGADGFIGRNLRVRLLELGHDDVIELTRSTPVEALENALENTDFVFHMAGVNRPQNPDEFAVGNTAYTERVCSSLARAHRRATMVLASSTQAVLDNAYGRSKLAAEAADRKGVV